MRPPRTFASILFRILIFGIQPLMSGHFGCQAFALPASIRCGKVTKPHCLLGSGHGVDGHYFFGIERSHVFQPFLTHYRAGFALAFSWDPRPDRSRVRLRRAQGRARDGICDPRPAGLAGAAKAERNQLRRLAVAASRPGPRYCCSLRSQ